MPTFPGPWRPSPGPLTIDAATTAPGTISTNYQVSNSTTAFGTLCEPTPTAGGWAGGGDLRILHAGGPDEYTLFQSKVVYQISDDLFLLPIAWAPALPWPAHAVDWEWENVTPQLWITSVDISIDVADDAGFAAPFREDVTLLLQAVDPASLTLFTSGPFNGLPEDQPLPGADLTTTHSTAMPAATGVVTLTAGLDRAAIRDIDDLTAAFNPLTAVVSFDNMRTHTPPAVGMGRFLIVQYPPTCAVNFTPPRWRFIFDRPRRLRQFPRDDSLGGSPRQGKTNGSTSVQGSARQGWRGTYR